MNFEYPKLYCKEIAVKLRKDIPLSQEQLANTADVSISQISRIERGLLNPALSTMYALAEAIDINPALLICDLLE